MIEAANIAGLEPAIYDSVLGFFRPVPVLFENRRTTNHDFAVSRDSHLNIGQGLAHGPQLVFPRCVNSDHRRSLGESVALMDTNANSRVPLREFTAQGCTAGYE